MNALTRARYLTRHYQDLQGYRLLPFAGAFLVIALNAAWLNIAQPTVSDSHILGFWQTTKGLPVTVLLLAFLMSHLIGRAYATRYGGVTPAPGTQPAFSRTAYGATALLGLLFGLLFAQPAAGPLLTWLWLTLSQARHHGKIRHAPASTIYLLMSVVLPMTRSGATDLQAFNYVPLGIWSLAAGVVTAFAAIHNHRLLLKLRPEPTLGEAT